MAYLKTALLLSITISLRAAEYANLETGEVSDYFRTQLSICDIQPASHNIEVVDKLLQTNGCFQPSYDHYKNGGKSDFLLTLNQAVHSLDLEYAQRREMLPSVNALADVILPIGVQATLEKRFAIVKTLLDRGYCIAKIHFVGHTEKVPVLEQMLASDEILTKESQNTLKYGIEFDIQTVECNDGYALQECIKRIALKTDRFYVAADDPFGPRMATTAAEVLEKGGTWSLGYASFPEKDWHRDLEQYGYVNDALPTPEAQIIAFCKSSWSIHARNVHNAAERWKALKQAQQQ